MTKQMTYNELMDILEAQNIRQFELANMLDMSRTGFKCAIENETLPIKKIVPLCNAIGITPNRFFGYAENFSTSQVQNGGIGNTQSINDGIALLQEQLKIKDQQIDKLLNLLNK